MSTDNTKRSSSSRDGVVTYREAADMKQAFTVLDRAAKTTYLMHYFAIGLIAENQLYLSAGFPSIHDYVAETFKYSESHTKDILTVFNRLSPYFLISSEKSSGAPDLQKLSEVQDSIAESPLSKVPTRNIRVLLKLSDTKLKNLITKGTVRLGPGENQYTVKDLASMDRDKLQSLITGEKKQSKEVKPMSQEEIDAVQNFTNDLTSSIHWQAVEHVKKLEKVLKNLDPSKHVYNTFMERVKPAIDEWIKQDLNPKFPIDKIAPVKK